MANELQAQATAGQTLYAVLLNSTGQIWNGTTFVTIAGANWTAYDIALTEATAGIYLGAMPAVGAGTYQFVVYVRAGGAPAITDTQADTGTIAWDGSAVVAPTAGYTTTAAVKTYLGISGAGDDTLLGTLIEAAKAIIDAYTGHTFEASADTTHYADALADVDGRTLRLPCDFAAITSITNGDGVAVAAGSYVTEPRASTPYYAVTLKGSSTTTWTYTTDPENAITIIGKAAYSTSAPYDIAQAAKRLASWLYRQKDAQVFDVTAELGAGILTIPQGMPKDVLRFLAPYRRQI